MARQTGLLKIKGTLDNVTFYKSKDGHLAKMKTSVDAARIASDPAFARTRENGKEFGNSASAGKMLRDSLRNITSNVSDRSIVPRMTQVMSQVKNQDITSARGARNVAVGIATANAKAILKGFEFNTQAMLGSVIFKPYSLAPATGVITISNFVPLTDLNFPSGATNVSITGGFGIINFATGVNDFKLTNPVNLPINSTSTSMTLTPTAVPTGTGTKVYLLKIEFFQIINGIQYSLKNGAYNALKVIEVA